MAVSQSASDRKLVDKFLIKYNWTRIYNRCSDKFQRMSL